MLKKEGFTFRSFFRLVFLLTISLYLVFSPSLNSLTFDIKRIAEVIIIGTVLISIFLGLNLRKSNLFFSFSSTHQLILASVGGLMVISSVLAENQLNAFLETSLYFGLLVFALTLGSLVKNHQQLIKAFIFITLATAALFYQANFFTAFLASFIENIPLQSPEPFGGFFNIRFFNQYQIWSISLLPLPLLLYPNLEKVLLRTLKIIAILWALLLFASGSRGAIGSALVSMLLTLCVFKNHAKPFLKLNAQILLKGFIVYTLLFVFIPLLFENNVTAQLIDIKRIAKNGERIELWMVAIKYIFEHPYLGVGPMHYAYYPGPEHAHPHNSILQWVCEMGVPSGLLMLYLTYAGLSAWVKKFYLLNAKENAYFSVHLWIGLFCSVCAGLIYSLVSGVFVMPLSQMIMAVIVGWMIGLYFSSYLSKSLTKNQNVAFMCFAGVTLFMLISTVITSYDFYQNASIQDFPVMAPRFWLRGGILH